MVVRHRSLALGSYVLASKLAGAVYDGHATDDGVAGSDPDSQPLTCTGRACFGLTYTVSAILCAISAVLMAWVGCRSAKRYVSPATAGLCWLLPRR